MINQKRIARLNSLLKEVVSEVIHTDVRNPEISSFVSVSKVEVSSDLHHAKVFISVIGPQLEKDTTIKALQKAAGFIGLQASKKVVLKYFPSLTFKLDQTVEDQMHIESILTEIRNEKKKSLDSE